MAAEYDFRAIPALGPGVDLLTATVDHYAVRSGRALTLGRIPRGLGRLCGP